MDPILIVVTAIALAIAAAMAVVVVVMLRQERSRSEARIEALGALAAEPIAPDVPSHASPRFSEHVDAPAREHVRRSPRIVPEPIGIDAAPEPPADLELRPAVVGVGDLFAEPERPSPWVNRLVAIGCLAAILIAIVVGITTFGSRTASESKASALQTAEKTDGTPLELVALRHTQESDRIVITGIVQNPRTALPLVHVAATVFVFGPGGAFLSSNQAPLDYTTLTPGGESQFVVSVPVNGQVARYRVGFRTEDGRVLPHVDKRAPDALAQK